jgi:hypothetical protein
MKWKFLSKKKAIFQRTGIPNVFYTEGEVFDGGAERFVYNNLIPHPLMPEFAGFISGQIRLVEPQVVVQNLALPVVPLIAGINAGYSVTDSLTDPNNLGSGTNAQYLQSVFGGVQA